MLSEQAMGRVNATQPFLNSFFKNYLRCLLTDFISGIGTLGGAFHLRCLRVRVLVAFAINK